MPTLRLTADTLLKPSWLPSGEIRAQTPNALLVKIRSGTKLECSNILHYEGETIDKQVYDGDDHFFIELSKPFGTSGESRWWVWCQHANVIEEEHPPLTDPPDEIISAERIAAAANIIKRTSPRAMAEGATKSVNKIADLGPSFSLPGFSRPRHIYEPICYLRGAPAPFSWGEATKNGQRIPENANITRKIREGCEYLMPAREKLGRLRINSWYRDRLTNRRVGGSRQSFHLLGHAVDFFPIDTPFDEGTWRSLCKIYRSGGLAAGNGFFHVDNRRYPAHWVYGGGPRWAHRR